MICHEGATDIRPTRWDGMECPVCHHHHKPAIVPHTVGSGMYTKEQIILEVDAFVFVF
jgi:hypothetical protein